jgi:hypothetical protein
MARLWGTGTFRGLLLLTALVVADAIAGSRLVLIGFFGVAPLVTASIGSLRQTVLVGAAAVVAAVAAGFWDGGFNSVDHVTRCALVLVLSAGAAGIAAVRTTREGRLTEALQVAEVAQRAILHTLPDRVGPVAVAASYLSANSEALVGGDFYDAEDTAFGVRLIIGDVRGKGLPAVRLAALVLGVFRGAAHTEADPAQLIVQLDQAVAREVARREAERLTEPGEDFVTALLVQITGTVLNIVNAGHRPPALVADDDFRILADPVAPPLGLESRPPAEQYAWGPGQRLFLYTDGLIEARNATGTFFTLETVESCLDHALDLDACLAKLQEQVLSHAGGHLNDDLALLLAELVPAPRGAQDTPSSPGWERWI